MFSYFAKPEDCADLCRIINNDLNNSVKRYPKRFMVRLFEITLFSTLWKDFPDCDLDLIKIK